MTWLDARPQMDLDVSRLPAATAVGQSDRYWVAEWASDVEWELELSMLQGESLGWEPLDEGVYVHVTEAPVPQKVCVVGVPSPDLQEQWAILLV